MSSLSIITPTYNSAATLDDCLRSVRDQKVSAEHLIIDGCSQDRTLEIARSYPHVSKIISARDKGIYDAMNKGIAAASGEVIGILNSDDFYADDLVLSRVVKAFADPAIDCCYGDLHYVNATNTEKVTRVWKSSRCRLSAFYWGWMPPHPTFFVRRSVYERFGQFDLNLGSAADYELILRFMFMHKISSVHIPHVLVKMRNGGESNASLRNRLKANRMDRRAWQINGLRPYPWTTLAKPVRKIGQLLSA